MAKQQRLQAIAAPGLAAVPRARDTRTLFHPFGATVRSVPLRLLAVLVAWEARLRERDHLAHLDERLLRDVGLTRADVQRQTELPFWRDR